MKQTSYFSYFFTGILLLVMALITLPTEAKIYKWVDAEGNTHYSETPPPNQQTETIKTRDLTEEQKAAAQKRLEELKEANKSSLEARSEAKEEKEKTREERKARTEACEAAKKALRNLQLGGNRLYKDDEGNYQRYSEEEKQKRIKQAQEAVKENCK